MHSIRTRLFGILIITTGLVWLSAALWIFLSTSSQLERVLDARLMEAARMVNSMVSRQALGTGLRVVPSTLPSEVHPAYNRQLSCQIWSLEGSLIGHSEGAPEVKLSDQKEGFADTVINGETWRVYTVENAQAGARVMVGDRIYFRDQLVNNVVAGVLFPALLIVPALAGLIWLSVGRGLMPLNRIADELSRRPASDLRPIDDADGAKELSPVVKALNALFARVSSARDRERDFTAFAAHELRTPMAGLKTQAQVALAATDPVTRENALSQIVVGTDRVGRLVRQLLDIAAIDVEPDGGAANHLNVADALRMIASELPAQVRARAELVIDLRLSELEIEMPMELLRLAARNLFENAMEHSTASDRVTCDVEAGVEEVTIWFSDDGPGIPEDEMSRVTDRFFRGRFKTAIGSGLGLSIVVRALEHAGGRLELRNRPEGGLSAGIVLPASKVRPPLSAAA